ncbi:MAG: hypothetical protein ACRDGP_01155 [Actinomycetota bacterium]
MPESKARRRSTPQPKRRDKTREARARDTQAAQNEAETRKLSPAAYTKRRVLGWSLVALGVVVFVQHLMHHMGFFTLISPGWDDLVAGYPLAAVLGIAGAIVLSRT